MRAFSRSPTEKRLRLRLYNETINRQRRHVQGLTVIDRVAAGSEPCHIASRLADPEQFRLFYAETLPRVYGYFLHRCGAETALAEDLTQETFLAVVNELRRGSVVSTPVAWVLGIARHKLLDHFRRQRRAGWSLISWESAVAENDDLLARPDDDEATRERAIAALAHVPLAQREAMVLHYLDGLPVAEVAALLGRSVSAAESLLARGRVNFRQRFTEIGDA